MLKKTNERFSLIGFAIVIVIALFSSSCAVGTTKLKISHGPLQTATAKKEGTVLVKQFVDNRKATEYIGNKRNGFGMVMGHVGTMGGVKLEVLLTKYFAEALQEAGYKTVIEEANVSQTEAPENFDAIIDGEILVFWMDLYMAVWHRIEVKVRALDPLKQDVLWEDVIKGAEKRTLWVGATAEYERIIREAMTKALNRAVEEFSSSEFYKAIKP